MLIDRNARDEWGVGDIPRRPGLVFTGAHENAGRDP
jgi:hypothetical protein